MAKLFERLVDEGRLNKQAALNEWALLLDWLFNDNKFDHWSSGYVGSLSKKIKRLDNLGKSNYVYDTYKNLSYPNIGFNKTVKIVMTKSNGEAKDLIRHIRNGIAHGNTNVYKTKGKLFIEITDYNKRKQQTAYIYIPIEYVTRIHTLFKEVEKSKNNDNKKSSYKRAA